MEGSSIYIEKVVRKIWESVKNEYDSVQTEYRQMPVEVLYQLTCEDIRRVPLNYTKDPYFSSLTLITRGCPHCNSGGEFGGCTFCDYIADYVPLLIKMTILRQRDVHRYASAVALGYERMTQKLSKTAALQFVTAFDTLSTEEVPEYVHRLCFHKEDEFIGTVCQAGFDTRASSVNKQALALWKNRVARRTGVNLGVEVDDDWLRNYWIHKNIHDSEIHEAIDILKEAGFEVSLSLLIGIPGLSQAQSIDLFVRTFGKLAEWQADSIIGGPLIRQNLTLQNYLYRRLSFHPKLEECGVVYGNETGMISAFALVEAVYRTVERYGMAARKLVLSPIIFTRYIQEYPRNAAVPVDEIIGVLARCSKTKRFEELVEYRSQLVKTEPYRFFLSRLEKEHQLSDIPRTIRLVAGELDKILWPDKQESMRCLLEDDLKSYTSMNG